MGELTFGVYMMVGLVGIVGVFFLLPKWRRKEIMNYIERISE